MLATGCMAQRYGVSLFDEMPEIDGVLGVDWVDNIEESVGTLIAGGSYRVEPGPPSFPAEERTVDSSENAVLLVRISDGCDRRCRFCAIPDIKGGYRSRRPEEISSEVRLLAGENPREVVLLAQDLTGYGLDLSGGEDLVSLLRRLEELPRVRWIRLLYLQPEGVTDELISRVVRSDKVCDYFDIPFQHASGKVLERMGRPGSAEDYLELIEKIRRASPQAAIRSTVMVGYPGEGEADFEELLQFVREAKFDWLGAFCFSEEEGTPAAGLGGTVPGETAVSRYNRLVALQDSIEESSAGRFEGRSLEVVIDEPARLEPYDFTGRSYREAPVVDGVVYLKDASGAGVGPGSFVRALVTGREGLDLVGEI